jgi:hypothetical protein
VPSLAILHVEPHRWLTVRRIADLVSPPRGRGLRLSVMSDGLLRAWGTDSDVVRPGRYRHYKGGEYVVYGLAHLADGEREGQDAVVYEPLYPVPGPPIAVRSVASWLESTESGAERFTRL